MPRKKKPQPSELARLYFALKARAGELYERADKIALDLVRELGHGFEILHRDGHKAVCIDNFLDPTPTVNKTVFRAHGIRRFELAERKHKSK
jgi:hypothetical protein